MRFCCNDDKMGKEKEANGAHKESAMETLMQHKVELSGLREVLAQKFLKRGESQDTFKMVEGVLRLEILLEDKKVEERTGFSPALSARLEDTLPPINYLVRRSKGMVYMIDMASVAFRPREMHEVQEPQH
jgi:hypothetical protein